MDCVHIDHDCKTSGGLIRDDLFTNWKFGFVFGSGCMTFKFLYSSASTFYDSYLRKNDTKISPPLNSLKWFKMNKPLTSFQVRGKTLLFIYHLEPLI